MLELLDRITLVATELLNMERHMGDLKSGESASDMMISDMEELRDELRGLRQRLVPYLERMPEGYAKTAFEKRYMEGISAAAIGRLLGYCRSQVYRLLNDAVKALAQEMA